MTEVPASTSPGLALLRDGGIPGDAREDDGVCLQISTAKLYRLLVCNALGVTEFRCLDRASKHRVKQLLLSACAQRLRVEALSLKRNAG